MIILSGSLAFDYIMNFPGYFEDHILPDKIHVLNVSFLVDSMDRQRGGVSGNIAYSLGLLGENCRLVGTVGEDFDDYAAVLEQLNVDTSRVLRLEGEVTASAFITTDRSDNQITGFFPGAMGRAAEQSIVDHLDGVTFGVVSPTAPDAMERHVEELANAKIPYLYDPGQQIVSLSGSALQAGIRSAHILASNDYELAMIEDKTGWSREEIVERVPVVVVTKGELGSTIYERGNTWDIPPVQAGSLVDPTGAGDGFRAGLLTGYLNDLSWDIAGRVAATAATYVVEQKGTQEHRYSTGEFIERFSDAFPEHRSAVEKLFKAERQPQQLDD